MTEFLFIRHAESVFNAEFKHLIGGRNNATPLTKKGESQAERLGGYLRTLDLAPVAVYSSGAARADSTAQISLKTADINQTMTIDERLQELTQDSFENRPRDEVYMPETVAHYRLNELDGKLPGGESISDAQARMLDFLDDAYRAHPEGSVLVFSHALAIRALVGALRGYSKSEILELSTPNVSLTSIVVDERRQRVEHVGKN